MTKAKKTKTEKRGAVKGRIQALNPKTGKWIRVNKKIYNLITQTYYYHVEAKNERRNTKNKST